MIPVWPRGPLERAVIGIAALWYAAFAARAAVQVAEQTYFPLFDDAAISMTYGRNLAEGHGLVWMPGEPAVEGYSNFLWTLVMAAFHLVPPGDGLAGLLVIGSGVGILLAYLCLILALTDLATNGPDPRARLAALGLTVAYYPLTFWTLRGTEVGLCALLIAATVLAACSPRWRSATRRHATVAALLAALVLLRDDLLLVTGALLFVTLWQTPAEQRRPALLGLATAVVFAKAAHLGFRWYYYGDLVPNTYYLKLTGQPWIERVTHGTTALAWAVVHHLHPVLLAAAVAIRSASPVAYALVTPVAVQVAYSVAVGGDAWEMFRFANRYLSPVVPLLFPVIAALAVTGPVGDRNRARVPWRGVAAAGAAAAGIALAWDTLQKDAVPTLAWNVWWGLQAAAAGTLAFVAWRSGPRISARQLVLLAAIGMQLTAARPMAEWWLHNAHEQKADAHTTRIGLWIRAHTEPRARVAVIRAGNTPYFARRPSVDLLGKNDPVIARRPAVAAVYPGHDRFDWDYSLRRYNPDVVAHVWWHGTSDTDLLEQHGYVQLPNLLWVRRGSARVHLGLGEPYQ